MKAQADAVHVYQVVDILHVEADVFTSRGASSDREQPLDGVNKDPRQGGRLLVPVRHLE